MVESIKEVIERLKNNKNSQKFEDIPSSNAEKPVEVSTNAEKPVEVSTNAEKPVEKIDPKIEEVNNQIKREIEMLQNEGLYRFELLHKLQEINKALVVMAGVMVDLAGKNE